MTPDPQPLEEIPDLPDLPEEASATRAAPPGTGGERPPLRVLDKAPLHLRTAALVVLAGSVLPWMPGKIAEPDSLGWLTTLLAKAIMGVAAWLWYQQVLHDSGAALGGVLGQLAGLVLKPKPKADDDEKKRRAKPRANPMHLEHPFPTGLHALALVLVVASLFVAARDPRLGIGGVSNGIPEVAMLGWAAFTWVHIASYERWGGFNPLFPLMFLAMLLSGTLAVIGAVSGEADGLAKLFGVVGGATVAGGGGLAAYTIVEAMVQAKKQGDRKKAEALEARRAARAKKG